MGYARVPSRRRRPPSSRRIHNFAIAARWSVLNTPHSMAMKVVGPNALGGREGEYERNQQGNSSICRRDARAYGRSASQLWRDVASMCACSGRLGAGSRRVGQVRRRPGQGRWLSLVRASRAMATRLLAQRPNGPQGGLSRRRRLAGRRRLCRASRASARLERSAEFHVG